MLEFCSKGRVTWVKGLTVTQAEKSKVNLPHRQDERYRGSNLETEKFQEIGGINYSTQ